ncbi:putative zinc alcohol dehydrogenase [Paraphaeosphaeria sporulosa]|uniref:Putative zinc alcohol dehydrogenase n=1 Tax=Paraphaeosphaeria sporulosa TaxID=1460663 RepID=A0A177C6Q8_9PLEO|nr:putative zinc alcohol dehydrogenase [Paraphaeosphaeria sporulosa]OAG02552.1 putative zinc alcohol dehydrogenase [Paraphaeosphaeria sporulosa]
MATMRAWQFTTLNTPFESNLTLNTVPKLVAPSQSTSEKKPSILIRIHAASLNPADHKVPLTPLIGHFLTPKPATPGLDYAGIVEAVPDGCPTTLKPGDKVLGRHEWPYQHGALAEYILGQPNGVVKLPDGLSFVQGAAIGTAAVSALQPLELAKIKEGDSVFINGGSGGVGSFTVQIAKLLGAGHVTVTCGPANVERMKALGADEVINYREVDVVDVLKAGAKDSGRFYDAVIENVGAVDSLYEECHHFLNSWGCFVQVAGTNVLFTAKRLILPGFLGGGKRKYRTYLASNVPEELQRIAAWVDEGKLKVEIDEEFAFEDAKEAFAKLRGGRARGKIVVRVPREGRA